MKGLGAGFHQPVEGIRYVSPSEQSNLLVREQDVLEYAKLHDFKVVATFNMTIARYKDFLEGNCACHFHKVCSSLKMILCIGQPDFMPLALRKCLLIKVKCKLSSAYSWHYYICTCMYIFVVFSG